MTPSLAITTPPNNLARPLGFVRILMDGVHQMAMLTSQGGAEGVCLCLPPKVDAEQGDCKVERLDGVVAR